MQDPEEIEVFKKFKDTIQVVFDVGARTDMSYENVEVHYFEPNPEFADTLDGIVNNYGLSDKEETLLYNPKTQSFIKDGFVPYKLFTLDKYAEDIPRVDFIKIDAEGMDYRILLGGKETLKRVKYIQFEWWNGVQKFVNLLRDFDLFLLHGERLYNDVIKPRTQDEKYKELLTPLTKDVIDFIDNVCIPLGAGGNVFGIRK